MYHSPRVTGLFLDNLRRRVVMKHRVACVFLLCLLALAGSAAWATICDIGAQPSATLLLPYFEVDLGASGTGQTTLFSINNASATAALAHVVVWSDLSV